LLTNRAPTTPEFFQSKIPGAVALGSRGINFRSLSDAIDTESAGGRFAWTGKGLCAPDFRCGRKTLVLRTNLRTYKEIPCRCDGSS
jgi:hypothetical protein